ncbi:MAG TPA: tRNA (adenosine(37)-N6)-threonylcarbamoyltransferase complex ATPase subunit type 1 TsaE [Candidatus Tectomicrobia bacterium]|jgi:tRNA threonylcarbamoyladenosine biosynthesis protein TsaE|nr:tRNA (adenosine(37)-N6)-threonylcarbamoyltransferase complex ATPase subunit type 1 TsaE [Candidatus Tectomicrobia bacterium]
MGVQLVSRRTDDTERLGEELGQLLAAGDIVCLYGELGTGKTVLSKGLATGLGVAGRETVRSPSFVLIHHYRGRIPVYHADLYRLSGPTDIADIGLRELLGGDGVAIVEWADKLESSLPSERLDISLEHQNEETRLITIQAQGSRYRGLVEQWQSRQQHTRTPTVNG